MVRQRTCKVCHTEKSIDEFYQCGEYNGKQYFSWTCKKCTNSVDRRDYYKEYYKKNRKKLNRYHSDYNKRYKQYRKEWKKSNSNHVREYTTSYFRKRMKSDELFAFGVRLRNLIRWSFTRKGSVKQSNTEEIIGCDVTFLREHLLHTWLDNYGTEWNGEPYHIDHIIPLVTAKTEQDIIELCHYTNLQLLKPKDNLKKGARAWGKRTL